MFCTGCEKKLDRLAFDGKRGGRDDEGTCRTCVVLGKAREYLEKQERGERGLPVPLPTPGSLLRKREPTWLKGVKRYAEKVGLIIWFDPHLLFMKWGIYDKATGERVGQYHVKEKAYTVRGGHKRRARSLLSMLRELSDHRLFLMR